MTGHREFMSIAATGGADRIFAALDEMVQRQVGAVITSCTTVDLVTMTAERVYTNQPDAYPLMGRKEIVPNRWTRAVLDRGQTFIANSIDEIRQVFPDHETIRQLGCESVINLPVGIAGRLLGTLNLLHGPGHFTPQRVRKAEELRMAAAIAFCALYLPPQPPQA